MPSLKPLTADINGRPYACLSELKVGDKIELDGDFTCHIAGIVEVQDLLSGALCFECNEGFHELAGQADDGEHCIGVYKV